jgi:hypothetical protein
MMRLRRERSFKMNIEEDLSSIEMFNVIIRGGGGCRHELGNCVVYF